MDKTSSFPLLPENAVYLAESYDVIVVGAGHAGCEAALASARLGVKTAVFTLNLDGIANMPCNPSIGGTAKGHLVREIDALGGEMGKAADKTFLQSRMLNRGKGPAVHSLRVQSDRRAYQQVMKHTLELTPNLDVKQAEVVSVNIENGRVLGIVTHTGAYYPAKCVIIAGGTYLKGKIIIGDTSYSGGPDGSRAAEGLSASLLEYGIKLMRFKTGTPARVNRSTVDFSKMERQDGDEKIVPFSFETKDAGENKESCYLTYTNAETHKIIMDNLHRSPLYSGKIEGVGPRYCPSIEDKVVRFSDKERHQLFIEPMGENTEEMYVQGMSSSLPEDVQIKMLRSIEGLENVKMMRTAYAIEYDCIDPTQLKLSLEFKEIDGLFGAGQFNGSSGYEEAAAQGLVAGVNAVRKSRGEEPFVLGRNEAYIGVLIDDLVTKGVDEPYRMFTSRAEYRILLRQDNADIRLTPVGRKISLVNDERWADFEQKKSLGESLKNFVQRQGVAPDEISDYLKTINSAPLSQKKKIADVLIRNNVSLFDLIEVVAPLKKFVASHNLSHEIIEQVEIEVKYSGYIEREKAIADKLQRLEEIRIPADFDFMKVTSITIEARQKLSRIRPATIGQASRIPGVSPADINVLLIYFGR